MDVENMKNKIQSTTPLMLLLGLTYIIDGVVLLITLTYLSSDLHDKVLRKILKDKIKKTKKYETK